MTSNSNTIFMHDNSTKQNNGNSMGNNVLLLLILRNSATMTVTYGNSTRNGIQNRDRNNTTSGTSTHNESIPISVIEVTIARRKVLMTVLVITMSVVVHP